ncbi:MAG: hypothetical protein O7C63_06255 [Alphaproteobacteria bacterium]|nr:hypothetical protein [Alphaproteobacteria bacterium]
MSLSVALLIAAAGVAAIVDSYRIFSHVWDEPAHIATGLELLDRGTYSYERQHPPLARIAVALGPYLDGARSHRVTSQFTIDEGLRILYRDGSPEGYQRTLTLARLGILPFFLVMLMAGWIWTRRLAGAWPATLTVFFIATVPPILGHAGLATTDVAAAALGLAGLVGASWWLEKPNWRRSSALGVAAGTAIMVKFSAIPFLGMGFLALAAWQAWIVFRTKQPKQHFSPIQPVVAVFTLLVVCWAAYGFGFAPLYDVEYTTRPGMIEAAPVTRFSSTMAKIRSPNFIPMIRDGIAEVKHHNAAGHKSFLLGEVRETGWWYYYPIVLAVKTPLPLLGLGLAGLVLMLATSLRRLD